MLNETNNTPEHPIEPQKIGGWLSLIGLGVVVGPLLTLNTIFNYHLKSFFDGTFARLTLASSDVYHPIYFPTLTLELFATIFIFATQLIQIYLFFKKDRRFPEVFSFFMILTAISSVFICISVASYPSPDKAVLNTTLKDAIRGVIGAIIWVSYMFKSVRVKKTFTRRFESLEFLNVHRTFVVPLVILSLMFGWVLLNKNAKVNTPISKKEQPDDTSTQNLKEMSSKEIADLTLKNLVVIEPMDKNGKILGVGSGFFILPDVIATNAHVVEGAYALQIRYPNSQRSDMASAIIGIDKATDLALVRTKEFRSENPLMLGNSDKLSVGSTIYTAGNPQGLEGTFTDGLVSNKQRFNGIEIVQISAPISQGSSGGPVLDSSGHVIGVSTAYLKTGQNLNLAISSLYISRLIMRTETFYPLSTNDELKANSSISTLFPQVCSYLVDIALPEKYFVEIPDKDLKEKEMQDLCAQAMPTCKKAFVNRATKGVVLIGSHQLPVKEIEKASREQFEKLTSDMMNSIKQKYRTGDANAQFKSSSKDINQHTYRYDIESRYTDNGEAYTDFRSMYFVLPYCRLDVLYSSSGHKDIDGAIYNILTDSFLKVLPGSRAEKALFKFGK